VPPEGKKIACPLCESPIFIPGADGDDSEAYTGAVDSLSPEEIAWPSDEQKGKEKPLPLFDGLPMTVPIGDGGMETDEAAPKAAAEASAPVAVDHEITEIPWVAGHALPSVTEPEEGEAPPVTTRLIEALSERLGGVRRWLFELPGEMKRSLSEDLGKTVPMRLLLLVAVVVGLSFLAVGYLGSLVSAKMERETLSEEYREKADVKDEEMDYIKAAEHYAVSIYIDPTNYKSLNNMASMYLQIHRYDDAIELLDEAISIIGTDDVAVSYANRGLAYLGLGDHDRALEDLNTAVAILPDLSYAYTARGFCYLAMEEYEKALAEFETACDLGDRNGCLLYEEHSADVDD